jgi:peptidoglycan/LPS O-acetylase OafA/YrhL
MPALDGLRAVAIVPVVLFHVFPDLLPGGFTGVDVFFVLSGFLISSLILHGLRDGSFTFGGFYARRIRRLLPNAVLTILVTVLLAHWLSLPSASRTVSHHALWALFNLSNFFIRDHIGGYWGDAAAAAPLVHTWSLAVEEQFYLLFPALLFSIARGRGLFPILGALAAVSLVFCVAFTPTARLVTFYLLPARAWELLLGALLAAWRTPVAVDRPLRTFRASWPIEIAGVLGMALILYGLATIHDDRGFPGSLALIPALGTLAVMVSAADGRSWVSRWLSTRPMVAIGRASYSLYLWHWPLITLARNYAGLTGRNETAFAIAGAFASVVVAILVYRTIEIPFRRRGPERWNRLGALAAGFAVTVVICALGLRGTVIADTRHAFDAVLFRGLVYNVSESVVGLRTGMPSKLADVEMSRPDARRERSWESGGILRSWGDTPPRVVVLGSSHALMYAGTIDDICRELGLSVAFLTADAAPVFFMAHVNESFPSPELASSFDAARRRWLEAWKPDVVIAVDRWDAFDDGGAGLEHRLRDLVAELGRSSRRVIVLTQPPVLRVGENLNLREFVAWRRRVDHSFRGIPPDGLDARRRALADQLESVERQDPRCRVLRADRDAYQADGTVRVWADRKFFYIDDDHLSEEGARLMREPLRGEIVAACGLGSGTR